MPFKDAEKKRAYHREYMRTYSKSVKEKLYHQQHGQKYQARLTQSQKSLCLAGKKKRNDETRGRSHERKRWTEQEIMAIWDSSRTTMQIASFLCRSKSAVMGARYKFASKAPGDYVHNGQRRAILSD